MTWVEVCDIIFKGGPEHRDKGGMGRVLWLDCRLTGTLIAWLD